MFLIVFIESLRIFRITARRVAADRVCIKRKRNAISRQFRRKLIFDSAPNKSISALPLSKNNTRSVYIGYVNDRTMRTQLSRFFRDRSRARSCAPSALSCLRVAAIGRLIRYDRQYDYAKRHVANGT